MESENYIYILRQKLGLTSKELAMLLDCNRGQVAMAEIGKRNLPAQSNLLLRNLELSLEEVEKTHSNFSEKDETLQQKFAKHLKSAQLERDNLALLLEKYTEKANKLALFSKTLSLLETTDLSAYSENAQLGLNIAQRKTASKLKELNLKIANYKIRIAGLSAEIAEAEKFI